MEYTGHEESLNRNRLICWSKGSRDRDLITTAIRPESLVHQSHVFTLIKEFGMDRREAMKETNTGCSDP